MSKKMVKKIVKSRRGESFEIDISDEACGRFGFKHGNHIIDNNNGEKGTIMGVAKSEYAEQTLWYALDRDNGKVSYSEPWEKGTLTLLH